MQTVNDNIEKKISEIDALTQSQSDRLTMQNQAFKHLTGFLTNHIGQITQGEELMREVKAAILERVRNTDNVEEIPLGALVKIFEILAKKDSEDKTAILNVLKESTKVVINNTPQEQQNNSSYSKTDLSQADMQKARKALALINRLEESEFSAEELKNKL